MGTLEPDLGKELNCGAHVCQDTCTQGFPARYSHPVCVLLQTHSLCILFTLKWD